MENPTIYAKTTAGKYKKIVTLVEAGRLAGISRQAVLKRINAGRLRAVRFTTEKGNYIFFVFAHEVKK
jgi:hypothetical protein